MQMKSVLEDNYWLKWNEQNLLGGVVGSGIGVVRTGGTKRREDINVFFLNNIIFATLYVYILSRT